MYHEKIIILLFIFACAKADVSQMIARGIKGKWKSLACELRPQEVRGDSETKIKSKWLKREFVFRARNEFDGKISTYTDPLCKDPEAEYFFAGTMEWRGAHEAAPTAQKVDFILDQEFTITPRAQDFVDQMNRLPYGTCGDKKWAMNSTQSILKKACTLFNVKQGEVVKEFDLIFLSPEGIFLFMGAKDVTGKESYREDDRPQGGLQVPLVPEHYLDYGI